MEKKQRKSKLALTSLRAQIAVLFILYRRDINIQRHADLFPIDFDAIKNYAAIPNQADWMKLNGKAFILLDQCLETFLSNQIQEA